MFLKISIGLVLVIIIMAFAGRSYYNSTQETLAQLNQNAKSFGFDPKSTDAYKLNTELLNSINALNQFAGLGKVVASRIITN